MKLWKIVSSIAAGAVALSLIVLFYSTPVNPCNLLPFSNANALLEPVTTKQLYDNAELVVVGRIADSTAKCEGTQIWTHMQVRVEEYLKNPQETKTLTAKSIGGTIGDYGYWVEDSPVYNKGDRVLLYLYKEKPEDRIYRISYPTGVIQDQDVTGRDLLESISLQSIHNDTISLVTGTNTTIAISLDSFFGYDSPTKVTATSFTFHNSSTPDYSNNGSITDLLDFGVTVGPANTLITPSANGTETIEFRLSAASEAIEGVYDIYFSATAEDDMYYYVNPSTAYAFVRLNVTGNSGDIQQSTMQLPGISLVIEKYGEREFYQDRKVFLPTMLSATKDDSTDWETLAWPSTGPNHVITRIDSVFEEKDDDSVVFDYYRSLGIDETLTGIVYDEFMKKRDLSLPPATSGRYFGFEWNQTVLDGTKASAGKYKVKLTMPILIDDSTTILLESEPDYFTILSGAPNYLEHDFSLLLNVSKTELETGETFDHSLLLINNGNRTEYFSMDGGGANFMSDEALFAANKNTEQEPCYFPAANGIKREDWGLMSMHANYFLGGKSVVSGSTLALANHTDISAPKYPGVYYLAGEITLTAADEEVEGKSEFDSVKVSCVDVAISNPILLNVTAPVYEGVSLVLETGKQIYQRGETVMMSLYVENKSDKPFKLQEVQPSISIRNESGRSVYGFSWVADYSEYPTVAPHSRHSLASTVSLNWDQTVYLEDGSSRPAETGEYSMLAVFTYPYLKSELFTIRIAD